MAAVAAILAVSLLLATTFTSASLGDLAGWAVCEVTSLGQGDCEIATVTSPEAHRPGEPCVLSSGARAVNVDIEILVVDAGTNRRFEVARQSDGRYRVTQLEGGSAGLTVGVGGGLTLTVADHTVGGAATAEAGFNLDVNTGKVWYTDDPQVVADIASHDTQDAVKDTVLGNGLERDIVDLGQRLLGQDPPDIPDPDETIQESGVEVNASAQVTGIAESAEASGKATVATSVRTNHDDGSITSYFTTTFEGEAGAESFGLDLDRQGGKLEGKVQLVTAVKQDRDGNLVELSTSGVASGQSAGVVNALFGGSTDDAASQSRGGMVVFQATLPVAGGTDRAVAGAYLQSLGISRLVPATGTTASVPTTAFVLDAARKRGTLTSQTFEVDTGTPFAVNGEARLGIELGAEASVESTDLQSTGASFFDGNEWIDRPECVTR
jgi:hypothetical protein